MANGDGKIAGKIGPLRSPQAEYLITKSPLNPAIGANTTIPGTAPKAAPIRSPLQGQKIQNRK